MRPEMCTIYKDDHRQKACSGYLDFSQGQDISLAAPLQLSCQPGGSTAWSIAEEPRQRRGSRLLVEEEVKSLC